MLARLRQLSPSTGGLDVSPHGHRDPFPRREPGWRSRSPVGLQPPPQACIEGAVGLRMRRRKAQPSVSM